MSATVYHYPNCGTCKKALKWLEAAGHEVTLVDIVLKPPSKAKLKALIRRSGLPIGRFFNTSGQSYRQGGWKDKIPGLSLDQAAAALAADGKLIKRPLVDAESFVLVGFKEPDWASAFGQ